MSIPSATRPYYVTTAIPYVNAEPHVGFALELVQADVLARYQRQKGRPVRFLTGTDDNSLKNARAAREAGEPVAAFVDRHAAVFQELRSLLQLSTDDFIRTSRDPRHREGVFALWAACEANGDFYRSSYEGLYCVGCEQFYRESDLIDGLCPEHKREPERVEEENVFFRLSRYQDALDEVIRSRVIDIQPEHHRQDILRFIDNGLEDLSVSRSIRRADGWGILVPTDPGQVIYVWFDALVNYVSALDVAHRGPAYRQFWEGDGERVHVLGKGITRFHAVIWPAILLSAGLPLPTRLVVHGYLTVDGQKIGKSLGNAVSPATLVASYGVDAVRHYLLRHVHSTGDSDVSDAKLVQAANTDLADKLGNLASRTTALTRRHRDGRIPRCGPLQPADASIVANANDLGPSLEASIESFELHEACASVWALVDEVNRYVAAQEPWVLAKQPSPSSKERFDTVLYVALESLRLVAVHLAPFVPSLSEALLTLLGVTGEEGRRVTSWGGLQEGTALGPKATLFPRV